MLHKAGILKYASVFGVLFLGIRIRSVLYAVPPLPSVEDTWWGYGESRDVDLEIKPFRISVPEKVLEDLQLRLNNTRAMTPPLEGINEEYGFNTNTLGKILEIWQNNYNWRVREKRLNQYPHFKTNIQGLDIHFVRVSPKTFTKTLPIILFHGWPSTFADYFKVIPALTTFSEQYGFAFEVIVPSLPGFVFSDSSKKPGLGSVEMANIFKNLMLRLGFQKFYIHGQDWGAVIAKNMATLFPEHVLGMHSTMMYSRTQISVLKFFLGALYPPLVVSSKYEKYMYPISSRVQSLLKESGYFHIQATKPDTIGVSHGDSPAGLAAYYLEKFSTAAGGDLTKFTNDELIDNIMLYWITNSATSGMRIYKEAISGQQAILEQIPVSENVPCAAIRFAREIIYQPDCILRDKFPNLIQATDYEDGGHFAALETPDILTHDIFSAVLKMEDFHKQRK